MNNHGHVVFYGTEGAAGLGTLYRLSSTNAQELVQSLQLVPGTTDQFINSPVELIQFPPKPNTRGHVAFAAKFSQGFDDPRPVIFRADAASLYSIAKYDGTNALGGSWRDFNTPTSLNDSNEFAFGGVANYPALSLRGAYFSGRVDELITKYFCFEGTTEPGGDGQYQSTLYGLSAINQRGEFVLGADLTGTSGGTTNNVVIYRGSASNQLIQISRRGDPAPGGLGRLNFTGLFTTKINEAGQVAFASSLAGPGVGTTNDSGIYVGSGGSLTAIVVENQLVPTTTTTQLRGVSLPTISSIHGVFAGDGVELINVARTGNPFEATFMRSFGVGRNGLNRHGQITYTANFQSSNAVLCWTPDLRWRFPTNGAWDAARRWTLSLTPAAMHHVFIQPTNAVIVTGPTNDVTVRSLNLGHATLQLQAGATLTATGGLFVATNTILSGNGGFVASFTNFGTISPGASAGALTVTGDVAFATSSVFVAELGGTAPGDFDRVHVQGNLSVTGALQIALINGHTLGDGQMYPIVTVSGTRTVQFTGLGEGALVRNHGGRELFITCTNGNDIALYTTRAALPNPTIDYQAGGPAVDLTFHGAAGQPYLLQRKADLNLPNWTTLQTLNAAPDGKVTYTDLSPPPFSAFYRITPP